MPSEIAAAAIRVEVASRAGLTGPVFRDVEPQCAPADFAPMKLLHRQFGVVFF